MISRQLECLCVNLEQSWKWLYVLLEGSSDSDFFLSNTAFKGEKNNDNYYIQ